MEYQFDCSTALCLACYFIIVQYVFVRFSQFRYVDVNGSSIANVHMVQLKFCVSAVFSLSFQNILATSLSISILKYKWPLKKTSIVLPSWLPIQ
jgi:hypothetical protein